MADKQRATVRWTGRGKVFEGTAGGGGRVLLDSDREEGPSPTEALLMSLAACMAVDIGMILEKGRVPLQKLEVEVEGDRAPDPPRRFTAIRLEVHVRGPSESDLPKVQRAVDLSRETYCSVLHTLQPGLELEISISRT